jgi:hypothetical protein
MNLHTLLKGIGCAELEINILSLQSGVLLKAMLLQIIICQMKPCRRRGIGQWITVS